MKAIHSSNNVYQTVTQLRSVTLKVVDNIANVTTQATDTLDQKNERLKDVDLIISRHLLRQLF
ncbi:MAG: hypothetical protein LUQ26_08975 [Methylococcaceae bacterium]|jgi:hypothetical protein|nr:hypothetical protein [Methylococcaceae bacterium]